MSDLYSRRLGTLAALMSWLHFYGAKCRALAALAYLFKIFGALILDSYALLAEEETFLGAYRLMMKIEHASFEIGKDLLFGIYRGSYYLRNLYPFLNPSHNLSSLAMASSSRSKPSKSSAHCKERVTEPPKSDYRIGEGSKSFDMILPLARLQLTPHMKRKIQEHHESSLFCRSLDGRNNSSHLLNELRNLWTLVKIVDWTGRRDGATQIWLQDVQSLNFVIQNQPWDPWLSLHRCRLPREIALELFQTFVIRGLLRQHIASNIGVAKRQIQEKKEPIIWEILEEVMRGHLYC